MQVIPSAVPDVLVIEPRIFGDARGFFMESYNERDMYAAGIDVHFVQDNHSRSARNVLRGLHYQITRPQGKLIRVTSGRIFDVAVDLRAGSTSFGQWTSVELSAENHRMLWIPAGFAHGFLVLSEFADVLYKASDYYAPEAERAVRWNDPQIGIDWPLDGEPILSAKDAVAAPFAQADIFEMTAE